MWEAMLLADSSVPKHERPEEPEDFQEYLSRQLEREGYDAQGNRLENLPKE